MKHKMEILLIKVKKGEPKCAVKIQIESNSKKSLKELEKLLTEKIENGVKGIPQKDRHH